MVIVEDAVVLGSIYNIVSECHVCMEPRDSSSSALLRTCAEGTCHGFLVHPSCYIELIERGITKCAACDKPYVLKITKQKKKCVCVYSPGGCQTICSSLVFVICSIAQGFGVYLVWVYGGLGVWLCVFLCFLILGYIYLHDAREIPWRCTDEEFTVGYS